MFFPSDGVYLFEMNNYGGGFNRVGDILWDQRDTNSNEFSYGISNEYFDGLRSMELISWSGSLMQSLMLFQMIVRLNFSLNQFGCLWIMKMVY